MPEIENLFDRPNDFKCSPIGTVEPYYFHIFLPLNLRAEEWPKNLVNSIDKLPGNVQEFGKILTHEKLKKFKSYIKVTFYENLHTDEIYLFPMNQCISLSKIKIEDFIKIIVNFLENVDFHHKFLRNIENDVYFVCSHQNRDSRCGYCGPVIVKLLKEDGHILSFKCSHVGGHKYAGNVIKFSTNLKKLCWYGHVTPSSIKDISNEDLAYVKVQSPNMPLTPTSGVSREEIIHFPLFRGYCLNYVFNHDSIHFIGVNLQSRYHHFMCRILNVFYYHGPSAMKAFRLLDSGSSLLYKSRKQNSILLPCLFIGSGGYIIYKYLYKN